MVYMIDADIESWLTTDRLKWADLHLLPSVIAFQNDHLSVQKLTAAHQSTSGILTVSQAPVSNYQSFASLRASALITPLEAHSRRMGRAQTLVSIETSGGVIVTLSFFSISEDNSEYACIPSFAAKNTRFDSESFNNLNYALVISSWTFNRMSGLFE